MQQYKKIHKGKLTRLYQNHYLAINGDGMLNEKIMAIIKEWNPIVLYPLLKAEYQYEIERIESGSRNNPQSVVHLSDLIYRTFKDSLEIRFRRQKKSTKAS